MAAIEALAPLKVRPFRRFFLGQAVSILGTWVQAVAMSWLVYRLTGSAALLGVTAFLSQAPQLVISPLAGLFIDRFDRRRLFLTIQSLLILHASALAVLTGLGLITPAALVTMAALFGVLNSFDTPLRQSMLGGLVGDKALLRGAIALNASLFNSARFVGPPLAGVILALTSESWCFAVNAVSFLGVALAVWSRPPAPPAAPGGAMADAFRQGLAFAWGHPPIRALLLGVGTLNLLGSAYVVLMPVLAKDVFAGDARTLGWLLGATGGGALAATFLVATRRGLDSLLRLVGAGWFLAAVGLAGLGGGTQLPMALAAGFLIGLGISSVNVSTNALLQSLAPDAVRGRVISYFTALRFGMDALGGLAAGALGGSLGVGETLGLEAGLVLVGAVVMAVTRRRLRLEPLEPP